MDNPNLISLKVFFIGIVFMVALLLWYWYKNRGKKPKHDSPIIEEEKKAVIVMTT